MISGRTSLAIFELNGLSHAGVTRSSYTIAFTPFCWQASSHFAGTNATALMPPSDIFLIVSALRTSSHAISGKNGFSSPRAPAALAHNVTKAMATLDAKHTERQPTSLIRLLGLI